MDHDVPISMEFFDWSQGQQQVRSTEQVLKLFAKASSDISQKDNSSDNNTPTLEADSCKDVVEESQPKKTIIVNVERQPRKNKLDIVRERSAAQIQSSAIDTTPRKRRPATRGFTTCWWAKFQRGSTSSGRAMGYWKSVGRALC